MGRVASIVQRWTITRTCCLVLLSLASCSKSMETVGKCDAIWYQPDMVGKLLAPFGGKIDDPEDRLQEKPLACA